MTMTESTPQTAPSAPPAAPAPAELLVSMTDAAAAKVQELRSREGKTDAALRLFVKSGGCSGYSYGLAFDDNIAEDDRVEQHGDVPVVIDAFSVQHVAGVQPGEAAPVELELRAGARDLAQRGKRQRRAADLHRASIGSWSPWSLAQAIASS